MSTTAGQFIKSYKIMLFAKSCQLYFQKSSTIDFWLSSKYDSSQYCQRKQSFKRYFSSSVKPFMSSFLSYFILLQNQKNVLQEEIKDWTFKTYLLTEEAISWLLLIESLKMACARSYVWFLNFLDFFCSMSCPNSVK